MNGRGFNWQIWAAPLVSFAALNSFPLLFVKWPITRDVPWANLLLFALATWLLVNGLRRTFTPGRLHSLLMIFSGGLSVLSAAMFALFVLVRFVWASGLPVASDAPKIGDRAPDFTLPDDRGRRVSLSSLLSTPLTVGSAAAGAPKGVLLIFYMYSQCRACNSEFRSMQQNLGALAAAGIRPVAISIDPPDVSRQLSEEAGYTFTFLSDPGMDVIRRYGVADQDEGARPAEFLLDASATVRWRYLTGNIFVRAKPGQVLDAATRLP